MDCQQPQRIDVVGARRRTPHRAPVQARRRRRSRDGRRTSSPITVADASTQLPDPHRRPHRLVAGAQPARDGPATPPAGPASIPANTTVAGARRRTPADRRRRPGPPRGGRDSSSATGRRRPARPPAAAAAASPAATSSACAGAAPARSAAQHHRDQRIQLSSARGAGGASRPRQRCGPAPAKLWTKHLLEPCKLLPAARLRGLTSRVCARPLEFATACRAVPRSRTGPASQQAPGPGFTRRRATTDNEGRHNHGRCNHEAAA